MTDMMFPALPTLSRDRAAPVSPANVLLAGASRIVLPRRRSAAASSLLALSLSCALHAAPLAVLGFGWRASPPVTAGEEVLDLELFVAEEETTAAIPSDAVETRPDKPDTPSIEAAQAPEKPQEEKPEPAEVIEQRPSDETPEPRLAPAEHKIISVANDAAPPAASDARQARFDARFSAQVARHLARFKRFPVGLRGERTTGRVVIHFALSNEGRITEVALVTPSGIAAFDSEALAMIRRAEPFPKAPEAGAAGQRFTIPVTYRLTD